MTIYGMQHIGFTVPDLDQAVCFFKKHFEAVECLSTGPIIAEDAYMRRRLGVPGSARIEEIKVLRVGQGTNLEIFQYSGDPDPTVELKRNSQPGGFHLAFQVENCNKTAESLRAAGVEVLDGPNFVDTGAMEGLTWCYLKAPWGQFLEIVSMDGPLGAERAGQPPQWSPVTNR